MNARYSVGSEPTGPYQLAILQDGYTRGDFAVRKWILCLSHDGANPIGRRGRAVGGVVARTSGKVAPQWFTRAQSWARAVGGVSAEDAGAAAEWFASHRVGVPVKVAA